MIDEVPRSPPQSRAAISPPPLANRHHAGHTPLHGSITGPLSPALSTFSARPDTPTRSNTTLNETLTMPDNDDRPLKGPLMMPELPSNPGSQNFTMDMLEAKLRDLVDHPEDSEPLVMKTATPDAIDSLQDKSTTHAPEPPAEKPASQPASAGSKSTSPSAAPTVATTDPLDRGIKLRKKPSCNFGAPLGQMNTAWKTY